MTALYPFLTQMFGRGLQHETAGDVPQERAGTLPLASWGDGPAFGLPGIAIQAREAWNRFASGQSPQPGDEVLAGLAMTGAGAFGLGRSAVSRGSVAGAERAEASSGLPSHNPSYGASNATHTKGSAVRAYRGAMRPEDDAYRAQSHGFWASSSPEVASQFARTHMDEGANVTPADLSFKNPLVVNEGGPVSTWMDIPFEGGVIDSEILARTARNRGHDGLVIHNIAEPGAPAATTYNALQRGTVTSPFDGSTLFSNPKEGGLAGWIASMMGRKEPVASGLPSHSVEAGSTPVRAYHSTYADFDRFDKAKSEEFGVHFGTPDQVNSRLVEKGGLEKRDGFENARVLPVDLQIKNPIDVRDLANWSPQDLAQQLMHKGVKFTRDEIATLDRANRRTGNTIIESALERAGYDALRYQNLSEGPGSSYAVWKPGTVKSATTGETLFSNPKDAAPVGVLAMDNASRMERARKLGFDTSEPLYHGTGAKFDEFDPAYLGGTYGPDELPAGFDLTPNKKLADWHAESHGPAGNTMSLFGKINEDTMIDATAGRMAFQSDAVKQAVRDMGVEFNDNTPVATVLKALGGGDDVRKALMSRGVTGLIHEMDGKLGMGRDPTYRFFDPTHIRRSDARFDPAQSNSANLLASNPPNAAPAGLLATGEGENPQQDFMLELLRRHGFIR